MVKHQLNSVREPMQYRKGQVLVSYLVMIIALFLVLYVILLPEQEKERLFVPYESGTTYPTDIVPNGYGRQGFLNLLSESPGLVTPFLEDLVQRPLASVHLFSLTSQGFLSLSQQFALTSNVLSEDSKSFTFTLDDLEHVESIKLLFFIVENDGELVITLNGQEILSGEVTSDMLPLTLPSALLRKNNRITFAVKSPPPFAFFLSNTYVLKDVTLVQDSRTENAVEQRQFVLSETELKNLEHLSLLYLLNCQTVEEQGRILIRLNGRAIHDALTVCDAGVTGIDLNFFDIVPGRNVLEFSIDRGSYVLEQMVLEGLVSQEDFSKYYFTLQVPEADALYRGAARGTLQLQFLRDGYRKAGAVYINGLPVYFSTSGVDFIADVTGLLVEGQNTVLLVPDTSFEVQALQLFLS